LLIEMEPNAHFPYNNLAGHLWNLPGRTDEQTERAK
jgi:hypothetical protein